MVDGFYINDHVNGRAFTEPCLPKAAALRSPTFGDLFNDGEGKSSETWTSIFCHLTNKAKEADAQTPVRGRYGLEQNLRQIKNIRFLKKQVNAWGTSRGPHGARSI